MAAQHASRHVRAPAAAHRPCCPPCRPAPRRARRHCRDHMARVGRGYAAARPRHRSPWLAELCLRHPPRHLDVDAGVSCLSCARWRCPPPAAARGGAPLVTSLGRRTGNNRCPASQLARVGGHRGAWRLFRILPHPATTSRPSSEDGAATRCRLARLAPLIDARGTCRTHGTVAQNSSLGPSGQWSLRGRTASHDANGRPGGLRGTAGLTEVPRIFC